MKKILSFILFFTSILVAQTPLMQKQLVNEFSITGSNTRNVQLILPSVAANSVELNSIGIPWKGAWSLHVYCTLVNGTAGTLDLKTKTGDWSDNIISLNDSTVLDTSITMQTGLLIYDIHNDKPLYSKWLYITREGAGSASVARFAIYQVWVAYKK